MPEPSTRFTLITATRLLDGTGAALLDQGALLIEGDRIVSLGRSAEVRVPDGAPCTCQPALPTRNPVEPFGLFRLLCGRHSVSSPL